MTDTLKTLVSVIVIVGVVPPVIFEAYHISPSTVLVVSSILV